MAYRKKSYPTDRTTTGLIISAVLMLITGVMFPLLGGCSSQDIPPVHKGQMLDRTGVFAFWIGGDGLTGPILGPGTYYTGIYDTLKLVDCGQDTAKETLDALTKDNVQFKLDVYVTYSANCENTEAFQAILNKIEPGSEDGRTIVKSQLYSRYIRPAVGEAVRSSVSPYKANDINTEREKIFSQIVDSFNKSIKELKPEVLLVEDVKLNNLDFPDTLEQANVERAAVTIAKEKAIAEKDKVSAQIETAEKRKELAKVEGEVEAARIDEIGKAWKRNPEYLNYKIYQEAGQKGNLIMTNGQIPLLVNRSVNQE